MEDAWVEAHRARFASSPELDRYDGLGHSLGQNPVYAPMTSEAQAALVESLTTTAS